MSDNSNSFISKETAKRLNVSYNYFHVMKTQNIERFRYVTSLNDDLEDAYIKYEEETEEVKAAMVDNYFWLEERRLVFDFSIVIWNAGVYAHRASFANCVKSILFKAKPGFGSHRTFLIYRKILALFEKYKQVNIDRKVFIQ